MAIAGFRYFAPLSFLAARVFRRNKAEIGHELLGVIKPRKVAKLRYHGSRHDNGNSPERLQCLDNGRHAPSGNQRFGICQ
jgi:hypothetical protein